MKSLLYIIFSKLNCFLLFQTQGHRPTDPLDGQRNNLEEAGLEKTEAQCPLQLRIKNLLPCKQRILQLSSHQPILWPGWWALRDCSMETNGLTIAKPSATADTPSGAPWGDSGWKRTRYWHWIAKVHSKGMISLSPDSCFFHYTEKS